MEVRRVNPADALPDYIRKLERRVASLETQPAGSITIRETLSTTDPITGVSTLFGVLPDGTTGFQPFVDDTTPPPVPSVPTATSQSGTVLVTWDGTFADGSTAPTDFQFCNIYGQRQSDSLTKLFGTVKNPYDSAIGGSDIVTVGESWVFWATSVDYNGNESIASTSTPAVSVASVITDPTLLTQLNALATQTSAAQATADGKNTVTYSTGPASGSGKTTGDIWFQTNASHVVIGQWQWSGTAWVSQTLDNSVLASLDAGKITTGYLAAGRLQAGTITAASGIIADINADVVTSGTVNASHVAIGAGSNALSDPGFNSTDITNSRTALSTGGTAGWTIANGASTAFRTVTRTTTSTNDQFNYITKSNTFANAGQMIPVVAGQSWVMKVDTTTSVSAGVCFNVYLAKADGTVSYVSASPYNTANGQRTVTYTYTIPAGVTGLMIGLACNTSGVTWTVHGNAFVGMQATGDLIVNGAINGQTITGAIVQTASAGARIVLDTTGLNGWDASGNNYLTASSSGVSVTGTLATIGSVSTSPTATTPMAAYMGQVPIFDPYGGGTNPIRTVPGLGFTSATAGHANINYNEVVCGIWSPDGVELDLTSGGIGGSGGGANVQLMESTATLYGWNQANVTGRGGVSITGQVGNVDIYGNSGVLIGGPGTMINGQSTDLRYFESNTVTSNPPSGSRWGPGILSRNAAHCFNDSFVSFPANDTIRFSEEGVYALSFFFNTHTTAQGAATAYWSDAGLVTSYYTTAKGSSVQLWEFSLDIPCFYIKPSVLSDYKITFAQFSGSTWTWDTTVRITKLGGPPNYFYGQ